MENMQVTSRAISGGSEVSIVILSGIHFVFIFSLLALCICSTRQCTE